MKEQINKIFKTFVDIFQMLDDFGAEEDKDGLLEMFNFAVLGIIASEKNEMPFKLSAEFKSEPVPNSTGSPLPHSPHTTLEPPIDEPMFLSSTDGYPTQYHDTTT